MENLLPIGQFAAASQLSHKALRLYAERGLLPPAWVDPDSGYRYYRPEQLRQATLIALLRRAEVPLAEIKAFVADPSSTLLLEYEERATADFAERRRVLRYVRKLIEEGTMYDVQTKTTARQPYASRSRRIRVPELETFIYDTFEELGAGAASAPSFVVYHGPVNEDDDGPVEVCVPADEGDRVLEAGQVAFTAIRGEQCVFPEILAAYEAVYRWVKDNGREVAGPPREVYLNDRGEEERVEITVPLKAGAPS
jgi:DNA-binding transcriptional MerR regulator/effector-binding domain-containing protein